MFHFTAAFSSVRMGTPTMSWAWSPPPRRSSCAPSGRWGRQQQQPRERTAAAAAGGAAAAGRGTPESSSQRSCKFVFIHATSKICQRCIPSLSFLLLVNQMSRKSCSFTKPFLKNPPVVYVSRVNLIIHAIFSKLYFKITVFLHYLASRALNRVSVSLSPYPCCMATLSLLLPNLSM